jgi:hypothetical protein
MTINRVKQDWQQLPVADSATHFDVDTFPRGSTRRAEMIRKNTRVAMKHL